MGLERKHNCSCFLLPRLELGGATNVVQKHDLVPRTVRAHPGLDCGHACLLLSFQVAHRVNKQVNPLRETDCAFRAAEHDQSSCPAAMKQLKLIFKVRTLQITPQFMHVTLSLCQPITFINQKSYMKIKWIKEPWLKGLEVCWPLMNTKVRRLVGVCTISGEWCFLSSSVTGTSASMWMDAGLWISVCMTHS